MHRELFTGPLVQQERVTWILLTTRTLCHVISILFLITLNTDALAIGLNPYKTGIGNIYLSEVNCVGDEANISSCSYRTQHDCVLHLEDAAILCKRMS